MGSHHFVHAVHVYLFCGTKLEQALMQGFLDLYNEH